MKYEISQEILAAIKDVESRHFRTCHDTGANSCAMIVWNTFRVNLGLSRIDRDDLPTFCHSCSKYHAKNDKCVGIKNWDF